MHNVKLYATQYMDVVAKHKQNTHGMMFLHKNGNQMSFSAGAEFGEWAAYNSENKCFDHGDYKRVGEHVVLTNKHDVEFMRIRDDEASWSKFAEDMLG